MEKFHPIKLTSVANKIEVELIINLLRNNDIPCFSKNKGLGQYIHIVMGYSIFGEDIYVDERDYSRAVELLNSLHSYEESANIEDIEEYQKLPFYKNPQILVRIYIIGLVATMLLVLLLNNT